MLLRYPQAQFLSTRGAFGVYFPGGTSIRLSASSLLPPEVMLDWVGLFAAWLEADPERFNGVLTMPSGLSAADPEQWRRVHGPCCSRAKEGLNTHDKDCPLPF